MKLDSVGKNSSLFLALINFKFKLLSVCRETNHKELRRTVNLDGFETGMFDE